MVGRKPLPSEIKIKTGNPGKRPINVWEPEPERGIPEMPAWLKEFPVAIEEWERETKELDAMGILTTADGNVLAMRCYLSSQIQELALDIKKEGRVAYTQKMDSLGNEIMEAKANPKAVQLKNIITEYRQLGSLLGLDPSSRTRLSVNKKGQKSKFDGLLSIPGGKVD